MAGIETIVLDCLGPESRARQSEERAAAAEERAAAAEARAAAAEARAQDAGGELDGLYQTVRVLARALVEAQDLARAARNERAGPGGQRSGTLSQRTTMDQIMATVDAALDG